VGLPIRQVTAGLGWGSEMTGPGRDARRWQHAMTAAGGSGPARPRRAARPGQRTAMRVLALAAVAHMLRSRRFYERAGVVAVALAALARMSRENRASTRTSPAARDKRQIQRLERKAKAQGRAVKGSPPGS